MARLGWLALLLMWLLPRAALASEDCYCPTPGAVAVPPLDPAPPWWQRVHRRTTAPHGLRFVGRAIAGLPFLPLATLVGSVGGVWAYVEESTPLFYGTQAAALGLAVPGGLGTAIALERALVDLQVRGLLVNPLAARIGHGTLIAGVGGFVLGIVLLATDSPADGYGLYLVFASAVVVPLAVVPYAIQIGQIHKVYSNLPPVPIERRAFSITPRLDPVRRTIGVTGTF